MGIYQLDDFSINPSEYPWGLPSLKPWALEFNGSSDYVSIGTLNPPTSQLTLELCVKFAVRSLTVHRSLISWGTWNQGVTIYFRSGGTQISINAGINSRREVSYSPIVVQGVWRHIALTIDTGVPQAIVYMDGASLGTVECLSGGANLPLSLHLNFGQYGGGSFFRGLMYDVRIWTVARTQVQIQDNMNKAMTGEEAGLHIHYPFSEGEGITLHGRPGDADGRIHGASWVELQ